MAAENGVSHALAMPNAALTPFFFQLHVLSQFGFLLDCAD